MDKTKFCWIGSSVFVNFVGRVIKFGGKTFGVENIRSKKNRFVAEINFKLKYEDKGKG